MNKDTSTSGCGLSSILTIIFVVLKLVGTIDWSWWWVLSPILIDVGFTLIILMGIAIYETYKEKKGDRDKWKF